MRFHDAFHERALLLRGEVRAVLDELDEYIRDLRIEVTPSSVLDVYVTKCSDCDGPCEIEFTFGTDCHLNNEISVIMDIDDVPNLYRLREIISIESFSVLFF